MNKNKSKLPKNGFVYLIIISTVFAVILSTANNPFKMSNEISVSETLEMVHTRANCHGHLAIPLPT